MSLWHQTNDPSLRSYGGERHTRLGGGVVEMGICDVSIPKTHRIGTISSASLFKLEFQEDEAKHIVLKRIVHKQPSVFYRELRSKVHGTRKKEAFLFIHGYNVTFEAAVKRAAQVAYDLRFKGAALAYSWPSKGGLAEYTRDEASVNWSVVHLETFLRQAPMQGKPQRELEGLTRRSLQEKLTEQQGAIVALRSLVNSLGDMQPSSSQQVLLRLLGKHLSPLPLPLRFWLEDEQTSPASVRP